MTDKKRLLAQWAKMELARREFFFYCNLKAPDFYKKNRKYLVEFCNTLQDFYESDDEVLIVNIPPRHGKSRTMGCFVEWILGRNQHEKIMTGSYNEQLSTTFAKSVRNTITQLKADVDKTVYTDVFPSVAIKRGDGAMNMWSLSGGYNNYLATSPSGTATGFGASILIIDDLVKNAEEAYNENVLEKHWEWYTNTMLSRLEEGAKVIIVMTRWHSMDLAGRALNHYIEMGAKIQHVSYKALLDDGSMLCPEILSKKSYDNKSKTIGFDIFSANYQQEPIDIKGRLYSSFKTYEDIPKDASGIPLFTEIRAYGDTADTGADYLCLIVYGVYQKEAYILDVLYSKEPMEITEPAAAEMLFRWAVNVADFESNNGGRGFARAVERILWEQYRSRWTRVKWFHQSENKVARIISAATWVMNHIYFPANWRSKFSEYCSAMTKYQREGKNKHDDAPDATTGIADTIGRNRNATIWTRDSFGGLL